MPDTTTSAPTGTKQSATFVVPFLLGAIFTALLGFALYYTQLHKAPETEVIATDLSQQQQQQVNSLIAQTLQEKPELVIDAIKTYQAQIAQKQAEAAKGQLAKYTEYFADDTFAPIAGNPKGDVTIVEFLDYNCGFCKRTADTVKKTISDDKNVRMVYMDMPILGPGSVIAATAALASREQGKYGEFHYALMKFRGRLDETSILKVAEETGLNIEKLQADMKNPKIKDDLQRNITIARSLNITGTPAFLINDTKIPGAISEAQLKQAIASARAQKDG